ncbi:MAG: hypothetical protein GC160_29625 [Acidobacteria bacterium]|nr:hypothetical protein [Acidobacteriota bacterium]
MQNAFHRALILLLAVGSLATAQNHAPNPYRVEEGWAKPPAGRAWGASSAVYPAPDGERIWAADRCGANLCVGSDLDPVFLFDKSGEVVRSFGKGLISWPHGMFVDKEGNVWIADAVGAEPSHLVPAGWGHVIYKFSPEGELLLTLGKRGIAGEGKDTFDKPSDVLVAPNGHIYVADGHFPGGNHRIVEFSPDGTFVRQWGREGSENGEFRDPHALAMDSQGRLFVGDRGNSRIQIFDQFGNHLATWTQFGRPSGIFIDAEDVIYVTDSESNATRNPGWKRGIRIGSARDGFVTAFIPDPETNQDGSLTSGAEGVAVDSAGNIYAAEVGPRALRKYVKR